LKSRQKVKAFKAYKKTISFSNGIKHLKTELKIFRKWMFPVLNVSGIGVSGIRMLSAPSCIKSKKAFSKDHVTSRTQVQTRTGDKFEVNLEPTNKPRCAVKLKLRLKTKL
jgi:hypothetical protein